MARARSAFPRIMDEPVPEYMSDFLYRQGHREKREYRVSQFWGDLGIVKLGTDDFIGALDAFLHSGHWRDAAHVAEQLLSREELLVYVRDRWPDALPRASEGQVLKDIRERIRFLCARRLARDLYFKDARSLYPPDLVPIFDRYVEHYRKFRDATQPRSERAEHGWRAAQIHRRLGLELFGTEVAPDWACYRGNFGRPDGYIVRRLDCGVGHPHRSESGKLSESQQLRRRTQELEGELSIWRRTGPVRRSFPPGGNIGGSGITPNFPTSTATTTATSPPISHGRRRRSCLITIAETAQVLGIAGSWIKTRYPEPADTFYKEMIWRNWSTPLARNADERRWFPKIAWNYDPWKSEGIAKPEWLSRGYLYW